MMRKKAAKKRALRLARRGPDVPDDFVCPECGVGKADFEMIEID
jgi:rubredoxin-NAD+ reductase